MAEHGLDFAKARPALFDATRRPGARLRLLVRGPAASGKSALLAAVRASAGPDAIVVDDAHDLPAAELDALAAAVADAPGVVVVATQPRPHNEALRLLAGAFGRAGSVVELAGLTISDVARLAPDADAAALVGLTGGSAGGILTILDAARSGELPADAAASWARSLVRRQDPQVLTALALAAAGAGIDPADVADVLGVAAADAAETVDRARASGLLDDADALLPTSVEPLRGLVGPRRFAELQTRTFDLLWAANALPAAVAIRLAGLGVRDPRLADALTGLAARARPADATALYAAAVATGADPEPFALAYADAAARAGDPATAMALADRVVARPDATPADLAAAVRVLGACWAQRGRLDRAAELYTWLGEARVGADAGLAAAVLYAVGRPTEAAQLAAGRSDGPPTDRSTASSALGAAVAASVAEPAAAPVTALVRVAAGAGADVATPLDAVAVAVTLCLHNGDIERAAGLLDRSSKTPLRAALGAWTAMLSGDDDAARSALPEARDELLAHGIRVGLARRSGDHGTLVAAWTAAQHVLDETYVDLFALLPLGELWLAAVRLDETARVGHLVDEATDLLNRLGGAQAWANTFHWYGVQAALLANSPAALVPHARALGRAAEHPAGDRYAAALAAAGRTWLRVLREEADPVDIERSARTLGTIGLQWDGARLASEGALRAADTATATTLLQIARDLRQHAAPAATDKPAASPLSEREADVAQLLVLGLTYREVGSRLYISAKTVEHHVARIRRRLGAGSRSELLSMLRALGYGDQDRSPGV